MLTPFVADLACDGVRLGIAGKDVLVDLPCSGAQILSVCGLMYCALQARWPAFLRHTVMLAVTALLLAFLGNALRISVLALGIAHAELLGIDVMANLPHSMIGGAIIGVVGACLYALWACVTQRRSLPVRRAENALDVAHFEQLQSTDFIRLPLTQSIPAKNNRGRLRRSLAGSTLALGFLGFALTVSALQPRPLDVSSRLLPPEVPAVAAGFLADTHPLSDLETRYFTTYGGSAARASYGPYGLLLVTTASPLRHLHDPAVCLRGMGYDVRLLGTDHTRATTVYVAEKHAPTPKSAMSSADDVTAPARYEVHVSYRSSDGEVASSISEVVWRWILRSVRSSPDGVASSSPLSPRSAHGSKPRWTMVQRIIPIDTALQPAEGHRFDTTMRRAFELGAPVNAAVALR